MYLYLYFNKCQSTCTLLVLYISTFICTLPHAWFWEIETVGTHEYEQVQVQDDQRAFLENLVYKDGRYEVSLPWVRDPHDVPNHYLLYRPFEAATPETAEEA